MESGNHSINSNDNLPSFVRNGQTLNGEVFTPQNLDSAENPKQNAALLFDGKWHDSQAAEIKNNLTALVFGNNAPAEINSSLQNRIEQAEVLLRNNWETLIETAKNHKDMAEFRHQSKDFWDNVRQMSEIRIVETYVNGKLEPRVVSSYGELLEQFKRSGANLETFLNSLSPNERNVFHARFQINQTFGANELFFGNGIALDKNGQFPLHIFLSSNGKPTDFPPFSFLGFGGKSEFSAENLLLLENRHIFSNGQFLLTSGNAALLGLSLAIYQNADAMLILKDVAVETLPSAKMPLEQTAARLSSGIESGKVSDAARLRNEIIIAAALVSGALMTAEKYRKAKFGRVDAWTDFDDEDSEYYFSAGATGALMGAAIGSVVPLAEKNIGEILGFTTGVIVGLNDDGLQKLGANALVSAIKNSVQDYLNAIQNYNDQQKTLSGKSANKFLNEAKPESVFENDLRQKIFAQRINPILIS